ncbi:MAG: DUF2877 domain-containing protein [Anaerolineales bacterium]|nr:DUF2877 domain-containing protein [Anaerolineales bacterium]
MRSSPFLPIRIESVAPRAQAWLRQPGPRTVLGVHRQVLYLEHTSGLLALTTADVPLSPLSARLADGCALPAAEIGDDATGWRFDVVAPAVWVARPDWTALDLPGLMPAVFDARASAEARLRAEAPEVLARGRAAPLASALLGLGPGLTPAGDDVLMGRLFALHAGLWTAGAGQVAALLAEAPSRTTRLSGAFLQAAAAGECSQSWQDLWPTPSEPPDGSRADAIRVILSIGQTSGAAALWGFMTATEAAKNHAPIRHNPGLPNGRRPSDPGEPT